MRLLRQQLLKTLLPRKALQHPRAKQASWLPWRTHRRAKFHDCLIEIAWAGWRQQVLCGRPQPALDRRALRVSRDLEEACQDAADIAIEHCVRLAKGNAD